MDEINLDNLYGTLPPPIFASRLCSRMRKHDKVQNAVSSRQAIAITKLLMATCFRKGNTDLSSEDYIRTAIISTAPEDQEIAREIALDILFPKLKIKTELSEPSAKRKGKKKDGKKILSEIVTETSNENEIASPISKDILDGLADFLDETATEFYLGEETGESVVEEETASDELDFYFTAINKWKTSAQPYQALINCLDDPTEILFQKIRSLEELTGYVSQKLLSSINNIPIKSLPAIVFSNVIKNILEDSSNPVEKAIAQHAQNMSAQFKESIDEMLRKNPTDLAKVAKALFDADKTTEKKFTNLVERAVKSSKTSSDIYNVIKISKQLTPKIKQKLFKMLSSEPSLARPMEMILSLENILQESISMEFMEKILSTPELEEKLSYHTLPFIPYYSKEVENAINKSCEKELEKLNTTKKPDQFEEFFKDMEKILEEVKNPYYYKMLKENLDKAGNDWLISISAKQSFLNIGHQLVRKRIKLDPDKIMAHGLKIGCFKDEINEMLYTDFEMFLKSIEKINKDFNGYHGMLKSLTLDKNQFETATNRAINYNNKAALAALATENLEIASTIADKKNSSDLLLSSLSAGPGDNLLKQWFIARDLIPSRMREKLKKILENIVISTAMDMARMKLGAAESGLMVSNQTRPYREGDEFDQIDIENTLENLISMGKEVNQIVPEDFMMHDLKKGRIALLVLLDISGSMTGIERLSYCAFLVTMLLARLREQEVAIAFFESDTHVVLEFMEEKPEIDKIVDELLEIKARGGTVVNRALTWAYEQFKKIGEEKLYFVVASDFELYYDIKEFKDFKGLQKLQPKTYLIAPRSGIKESELKMWEKEFKGHVIRIKDEKEIIDTVCTIISNR